MRVAEAVDFYRYAILHLSKQTQSWSIGRLTQFATWCDENEYQLENVKAIQLRKYIEYLRTKPHFRTGQKLSTYTIHGHARVIRTFLNWCSKEDGLDHLVSEKTARRMTMPKIEEKIIEVFTPLQIKALLVACDREAQPSWRVRDRAILSVLIDTGIRAGELCGLTLDHVYLDINDAYLKVSGKGEKEREVPLGKVARTALHKYIGRTRKASESEKHVFLNRFNHPFTVSGLVQIIERLGKWARVEGVRCSCHTFRHTYACNYLKNGGDLFKLSRLLGHTSIKTTVMYLKAFQARDARQGAESQLDNL